MNERLVTVAMGKMDYITKIARPMSETVCEECGAEHHSTIRLHKDVMQQLLTNLTVAADRLMENWSESDADSRHRLWVDLGNAAREAGEEVYPLGMYGRPYAGPVPESGAPRCEWTYRVEVDDGPLIQRCVLPRHNGHVEHRYV